MKNEKIKAMALVVCAVLIVSFSGIAGATSDIPNPNNVLETKPGEITATIAETPYSILTIDIGVPENHDALDILGIDYTIVSPSEFYSVDLSKYDVLYVGWTSGATTAGMQALYDQRADISAFVDGGGGLVALSNRGDSAYEWQWIPVSVEYCQLDTDSVTITMPDHPIMSGLTSSDLGGWGNAVHTPFTVYPADMDVLAVETSSGDAVDLAMQYGSGRMVLSGQDPDYHIAHGGYVGAEILLANMLDWAAEGVAGPSVSITTDRFEYSPGDTMIRHLEINNPTASPVTFNMYLGVPQFAYWGTMASASIPAGFSYSDDLPFPVGDWGNASFGMVWYVELTDGTGEVLDSDAATCAYSPLDMMVSKTSDAVGAIEESVRKAGQ